MLNKINAINQMNNLYSDQKFKQQNFGHKIIHLEHHLMVNDVPFRAVVRKLENLLGGRIEHYRENGKHIVEIGIPEDVRPQSILDRLSEIEKKAYSIKDLEVEGAKNQPSVNPK